MVLYAKDILVKDFLAFSREMTVLDAVQAMKGARRGFAIVGQAENPEGIVTEWDIVSKVVAEGKDPA